MCDTVPVRRRESAARLFEAQAERTPGAIALVHGDTSLTYAQLNAEANRQAHYLISLGLGAEDIAAIAMPRSAAAIVAILGVLKSGAAYLPLDLRNPPKHLARVLDHARPACVIALEHHRGQPAASDRPGACHRARRRGDGGGDRAAADGQSA